MHWYTLICINFISLQLFKILRLYAVHDNLEILKWTCYSILWPMPKLISYLGNQNKMMIILHLKNSDSEFLFSTKPFLYLNFIRWCVCLLFLTFLRFNFINFFSFLFLQGLCGKELNRDTRMANHLLQALLFLLSFIHLFIGS